MRLNRTWIKEGWVEHTGGECPIHHNDWIDKVLYRSGDIATAGMRAGVINWRHDPYFPICDIVAFLPEEKS